ncbi:metal-dependent hydrolase [Massilia sp. MS-15]|uniref:metal-dependent hydrolase n=1 Tax=Massilia sp. MS-15 TaxID=2878200 RepID=UPI001CD74698|nr:metal-dependent hydrolase [Massilia sp. MS-15]MCA1246154.1 metal-dependent hydrolase [Massilia sp. MS-15]
MPTVLTHAVVPVALALVPGVGGGAGRLPPRLLLCAMVAAMLPDADAAGYWLGVPYAALAGHRGLSHSLAFALALGLLAALLARRLRSRVLPAACFVGACTLSHPLLDMLTTGGQGVALWAPWSSERLFFALRPIEVAPLAPARMLGDRGLVVLASELRWVWLPAGALGLSCVAWRWLRAATRRRSPRFSPSPGPERRR